jgi:hypothetical protein
MTDAGKEFPRDAPSQLQEMIPTTMEVLTDPKSFFTSMPKEGGYEAPGTFAVVALVTYGVLLALLSLLRFHVGGLIASLILMPVFGIIGLLVGAAIVLFASRALGGEASFESSFRIASYSSAIAPIQAAAHAIPYLHILVSAYGFYLLIVAVIAVHRVPEQQAWRVLGGIAAVLLVLSFFATLSARTLASKMETMKPKLDEFSHQMQKQAEEMQKAAEKMQQEMQRQQQSR